MKNSNLIGKAGEYRVLSELLLRGQNPAITSIDNGVDIILPNRRTISVKTTSKANAYGKYYSVSFTTPRHLEKDKTVRTSRPMTDFVIVWRIDKDDFYIIPKTAIGRRKCISLGSPKSPLEKFRNNWEELWEGVN